MRNIDLKTKRQESGKVEKVESGYFEERKRTIPVGRGLGRQEWVTGCEYDQSRLYTSKKIS
jgi:hypothetical protein